MSGMNATRVAQHLHDAYDRNEFDGSDSILKLSASKYAVIVEREEDGWVLAANDASDLASILLATYTGTEGYDESVTDVISIETGESVSWGHTVRVSCTLAGECGADTTGTEAER